jgi:nucleotide-binding universal stress UspA family protein
VNRPSPIVPAVDFSAAARAAFDQALALSRSQGAELMVVHAVPANQPFRWRARERMRLIASLREMAEAADEHGVYAPATGAAPAALVSAAANTGGLAWQ